jgi:hypothetical protein
VDVSTSAAAILESGRTALLEPPDGPASAASLLPGTLGIRTAGTLGTPASREAFVSRPADRPVVAPLAPARYRVQFTMGEETHEKLRRVQDLLRREIPDGDPGSIFDRALTLLLEDVGRKKLAETSKPRPPAAATTSRDVPAAVKRAVWTRDGGQCAFVAAHGRRCTERGFLELHHREPYALGGEATVDNISLRCRAHHAYETELAFGPRIAHLEREPGEERRESRGGGVDSPRGESESERVCAGRRRTPAQSVAIGMPSALAAVMRRSP